MLWIHEMRTESLSTAYTRPSRKLNMSFNHVGSVSGSISSPARAVLSKSEAHDKVNSRQHLLPECQCTHCTEHVSCLVQQESLLSHPLHSGLYGSFSLGRLSQGIWQLQLPSILHYSSQRTSQKFFWTMPIKQDSIFAWALERFSRSSPLLES